MIGFAGQHGFVHLDLARQDNEVGSRLIARCNRHDVVEDDLFGFDGNDRAVTDNAVFGAGDDPQLFDDLQALDLLKGAHTDVHHRRDEKDEFGEPETGVRDIFMTGGVQKDRQSE